MRHDGYGSAFSSCCSQLGLFRLGLGIEDVDYEASLGPTPGFKLRQRFPNWWGVWGLFLLLKTRIRPPFRYFAMAIGMISGGIAMGGLAQALLLLVGIIRHG